MKGLIPYVIAAVAIASVAIAQQPPAPDVIEPAPHSKASEPVESAIALKQQEIAYLTQLKNLDPLVMEHEQVGTINFHKLSSG